MKTFARALVAVGLLGLTARADSLTKTFTVDFFRDVPSRNLRGLATRSDGRLVAGPTLTDLEGALGADLAWSLAPGPNPETWYVGTGPDGRVLEARIDAAKGRVTSREWGRVDDTQVFALCALGDGSLAAGGSPKGSLTLLRDGKSVARVFLPVDTVLDLLRLPGARAGQAGDLLVATGNPGRVYRVDLAKFAKAGLATAKATDASLAAAGITVFGEIRDRNVRRLALLPDGRVLAGSSPDGNVYAFPAAGGAPLMLMENRDAEVTDFAVNADGSFFASIVATSAPADTRIQRVVRAVPTPPPAQPQAPQQPPVPPAPGAQAQAAAQQEAPAASQPAASPEKFAGRAFVVSFSPTGFPEIAVNRANQSIYRMLPHDGTLVIAGGEQGDLSGYDPDSRLALTFAGSVSAQLNDLEPWPGTPDRFVLLRNNPAGLSLLDFAAKGPRSAETRKLDIGLLSILGAVRTARIRDLPAEKFDVEARVSNGGDETEGWTAWTQMPPLDAGSVANVGWKAASALRGRYVKIRVSLPETAPADAALDKLGWYYTPQDRRPVLSEFRILDPEYGLIPAADPTPSPVISLSQLISQSQATDTGDKRRTNFLNSQVVPMPGYQVFVWTVTDADGDNLLSSFYLRRDGDKDWTPAVLDSQSNYAQVDISHLKEGVYFTRLVVKEGPPRPEAERLTTTFETDLFVVDRTPPAILDASARVAGDRLVVTVHGRDNLSILAGLELTFNQGDHEVTEQPVDGVRDSREETFTIDVPLARVAGATQVEAALYDANGNRTTRVLKW